MEGTTLPGRGAVDMVAEAPQRRPLAHWLAAAALALAIALAAAVVGGLQGDPDLMQRIGSDPRLWAAVAGILLLLIAGLVLGRSRAPTPDAPARDLRLAGLAAAAGSAGPVAPMATQIGVPIAPIAGSAADPAPAAPRPAVPAPFAALVGPLVIEDLALLEDALAAGDADMAWQAAQRLSETGQDLGLDALATSAGALRDALDGTSPGEPAVLLDAVRDGVAALAPR